MTFSGSQNYMESLTSHSLLHLRVFTEHFQYASVKLGSGDRVMTKQHAILNLTLGKESSQIKHMITIECDKWLAEERIRCMYTMEYCLSGKG